MSDFLQSCELQHTRPPCPSPVHKVAFFMSIEWVISSNDLILCRPLFFLPSIFPSISLPMSQFFSSGGQRLEFQHQHQSFQRIFRTDILRIDWFDPLAVQGTLKSLLQHRSLKASILWHSAFFIVQLSHPYMTTGKTIALTRQTFVGKIMSLLFNILSKLNITFLLRRKHLLNS